MSKDTGRAPRPVRRMGTEVIKDRRTRRQRTRSDELRAVLDDLADEEPEDLEELYSVLAEDESDSDLDILDDYLYGRDTYFYGDDYDE